MYNGDVHFDPPFAGNPNSALLHPKMITPMIMLLCGVHLKARQGGEHVRRHHFSCLSVIMSIDP